MREGRSAAARLNAALAAVCVCLVACGGAETVDLRVSASGELPGDLELPSSATMVGPVWTLGPGTKDAEQAVYLEVVGDVDAAAEDLARLGQDSVEVPKKWSGVPLPGATCDTEAEDASSGPVDRVCGWADSGLKFKGWWPFTFLLHQDLTPADAPTSGVIRWRGDATDLVIPPPGGQAGPTTVGGRIAGEDLDIAAGSYVAGESWVDSATGGYCVIIGVTGDPDGVFDAYVAQDPLESTDEDTDEQHGELHYRRYRSSGAGAGGFSVVLNEAGGNAWLLVERWND